MIVVIMIGIMMIFLMNNSGDNDFDHYFLNCYVLKILFIIRFFLILSFNI
jgi:hypothetical protein